MGPSVLADWTDIEHLENQRKLIRLTNVTIKMLLFPEKKKKNSKGRIVNVCSVLSHLALSSGG